MFLPLKMSLNLIPRLLWCPPKHCLVSFPDMFAIEHVSDLSTDVRYNCASETVLFKWINDS